MSDLEDDLTELMRSWQRFEESNNNIKYTMRNCGETLEKVVKGKDVCPVCGEPYNHTLSGFVGDGQPLDVSEYSKCCFEKLEGGKFWNYIHE